MGTTGAKGSANCQTLPFMPNLLPYLLKLDPSKPSYMGSFRGVWEGYAYYFQGMLYGFNWGVVSPMTCLRLQCRSNQSLRPS
jgi:hypothetical protein